MAKHAPDLFAAIHVGSEMVGVQIVEYRSLDDFRILDQAWRQVMLGEETFKTGRISFGAITHICELLKGYRRLLSEYGVRDYRLVATTAIREAQNQAYIIDQIRVKTGFSVDVVDMPQEIFYKYLALFLSVHRHGLTARKGGLLFVDISSGGLGITLYKEGVLTYQQNIHIGALRIKESFDKKQRDSAYFLQALSEYIYSTIEPVEHEMRKHKNMYLVLSGTETRLLLKMLGREEPNGELSFVSLEEFTAIYEQVMTLTLGQLTKRFGFTEQKAEMVLPTIVLYQHILSLAQFQEIVIPADQFIDGIRVLHIMERAKDERRELIEEQIVSLAHTIGRKYQYDEVHAADVTRWALLIFDRMGRVHGLGKRERRLLRVAAILHDIGKFISLRRHYFYSYRLILSSDILGFSEKEKWVMANVAHYHDKGTPKETEHNFTALSLKEQVLVSKLAAIIRLADALDCSRGQKISHADVNFRGDEMQVTVIAQQDISLEEWTFAARSQFFEDVFGIKAILKRNAG
ncbi:MAG TPA: HD domain-containing protein [Patescibacteria group bacterium]|nr:HD domain-containing protein [Patescibacteria group bacterium]